MRCLGLSYQTRNRIGHQHFLTLHDSAEQFAGNHYDPCCTVAFALTRPCNAERARPVLGGLSWFRQVRMETKLRTPTALVAVLASSNDFEL